MLERNRKTDILVFMGIITIIIIQLIKLGDYPGLYFDSINPDYIGIQILYPTAQDTRWQVAWPWLCQVYHGNVGIIITMLSTIITGKTSILQYHITYGLVAALAVFLTYRVLTHPHVGISRLWAGITALALISWPSLLTILITQFYMCLFGSVCILSGTLFFLDWVENIRDFKKLCICYILFGIAFYSYFNFLFFLPSLWICTLLVLKKENCLSYDTALQPLISYVIGCGLFLVGWAQMALCSYGINMTLARKASLFITVYGLIMLIYIAFRKKWKMRWKLIIAYGVSAIVAAILILPSFMKAAENLQVVDGTTLWEKIKAVFMDYEYILTGKYAESMIFKEDVTVFNKWVLWAVIGIVIGTLILELVSKRFFMVWKIPIVVLAIYLVCCFAFGTRMQPQHYVPLVFLTFIIIVLSIHSGLAVVRTLRLGNVHWNWCLGLLAGSIIFLNLFNDARIINKIQDTGGEDKYAAELTELADTALENKKSGKKELYIFDSWGFFTSFVYLTMNNIPYVVSIDESQIMQYYAEGYDIVACYWKQEDESAYSQLFYSASGGSGVISVQECEDKNGKTEFYEIILSGEGDNADEK